MLGFVNTGLGRLPNPSSGIVKPTPPNFTQIGLECHREGRRPVAVHWPVEGRLLVSGSGIIGGWGVGGGQVRVLMALLLGRQR